MHGLVASVTDWGYVYLAERVSRRAARRCAQQRFSEKGC